jgi:hypothetical protein
MEDFINPELLDRFKQVGSLMSSILRKEIIEDMGYSRLKNKALDFISKLRMTEKLLDEKKEKERD